VRTTRNLEGDDVKECSAASNSGRLCRIAIIRDAISAMLRFVEAQQPPRPEEPRAPASSHLIDRPYRHQFNLGTPPGSKSTSHGRLLQADGQPLQYLQFNHLICPTKLSMPCHLAWLEVKVGPDGEVMPADWLLSSR
jgi:hypothetical protein